MLDALPGPVLRDFFDELRQLRHHRRHPALGVPADPAVRHRDQARRPRAARRCRPDPDPGRGRRADDHGRRRRRRVVRSRLSALTACLLVAAIIATTDPSAVTAVFREVGARRRLVLLVEGESLLNDAAAIALFTVLLGLVTARRGAGRVHRRLATSRSSSRIDFVGGAAVGVALGPDRRHPGQPDRPGRPGRGDPERRPGLPRLRAGRSATSTSPAWSRWSLAGLVFGTIGRMRVGTKEWESVSVIWSQLGFWASSLVFVLASMLVPETDPPGPARAISCCSRRSWSGALSARALCLWGVLPIVRMLLRQRPISSPLQARHPLGRRARRRDPGSGPGRRRERRASRPRCATSSRCWPPASCCSPCWCRPPPCAPLIHWLGVDQLDPVERILRARALALTQGEILDRLSETAIIHGLDLEAADEVGALYRKRVETLGGIGRARRGHAAPAAHRGPGHDHRPRGLLLHRRDGRGDDLAHRRLAPAQPDQRAARRAARRQRPALPQGGPGRDRSRLCHPDRRLPPSPARGSTARWPDAWPSASSCA